MEASVSLTVTSPKGGISFTDSHVPKDKLVSFLFSFCQLYGLGIFILALFSEFMLLIPVTSISEQKLSMKHRFLTFQLFNVRNGSHVAIL